MIVLECKYYVMTGKKGKKNMPNHFEYSDKKFFFSLHLPNVENIFFATKYIAQTISKMIDVI